ncbi:MAG: SRPBCC family protein [Methylocystis sp.]
MTGVLLVLLYFLLAALAAVIILQPDRFVVSRSRTIAAPQRTLFTLVNDLHRFESWSPWAEFNSSDDKTFEGPRAGEGASLVWSGDRRAGKITIVSSKADESVEIKLDMQKPVAAQNDVHFLITPEGQGSKVEWTLVGRRGLLDKAMNLLLRYDAKIGAQFERGLVRLEETATKGGV